MHYHMDGLYHRVIIQSGVGFFPENHGEGTDIVEALLDELKIASVEELESVEYDVLSKAYNQVFMGVLNKGSYVGGRPKMNEFFLGNPLIIGFREEVKNIPILIGTVTEELSLDRKFIDKWEWNQEDIERLINEKYKENATMVSELFVKAYQGKCLLDIINIDVILRGSVIDFIAKATKSNDALVYAYVFAYETTYNGGRSAYHCAEIPFVFHNTEKVPISNNGEISELLEEQVSRAWINFAKTGNPNHDKLIDWNACENDREYTMIFDEECRVRENYDHELVKTLSELRPSLEDIINALIASMKK